jgi:carboxymethylenebutenolidase
MHVLIEEEFEVRTADGIADCVLFRSPEDARPAVIHLPDGIGMRPSQRQMARRVAAEGYTVLLPNIYYRTSRPPFFEGKFDFADEKMRARFMELTAEVPPDAMDRDGASYVDFLASHPSVSGQRMGVVGYCFTGAFALRVAAVRPERIAAAASFHGGRLFRDDATSPHLVLPRVKARLYFGHARDDQGMPADAIQKLESALEGWGGRYESETYDARHGWTVPDSPVYNAAEAERAYAKLRELFAATLS